MAATTFLGFATFLTSTGSSVTSVVFTSSITSSTTTSLFLAFSALASALASAFSCLGVSFVSSSRTVTLGSSIPSGCDCSEVTPPSNEASFLTSLISSVTSSVVSLLVSSTVCSLTIVVSSVTTSTTVSPSAGVSGVTTSSVGAVFTPAAGLSTNLPSLMIILGARPFSSASIFDLPLRPFFFFLSLVFLEIAAVALSAWSLVASSLSLRAFSFSYFLNPSSTSSNDPLYRNKLAGIWFNSPVESLLKSLIVEAIGTDIPGIPENFSATTNGCVRKFLILRADRTTSLSSSERPLSPRIIITSSNWFICSRILIIFEAVS